MDDVRVRVQAVVLAVVLVVGVAACGGGDAPEVVSQAPSTTDGGTTTETDDTTDFGSIDDLAPGVLPDGAEECIEIGLAYASLSLGMLGGAFGASASDLEQMNSELEDLEAKLPAEIRDDFQVVGEAIAEFGNAMTAAGGNILDPANQQAMEEAAAAMETPEVKAAQAEIEAYLDRECPDSGFNAG